MSFRASKARHGIQYFEQVLDTGFRRYDGLEGTFINYDTASNAGIHCYLSSYMSLTPAFAGVTGKGISVLQKDRQNFVDVYSLSD
jgi:hypothetical protein